VSLILRLSLVLDITHFHKKWELILYFADFSFLYVTLISFDSAFIFPLTFLSESRKLIMKRKPVIENSDEIPIFRKNI